MNATEYKNYHESFMTNNHGSTAAHTFFCILFTVQCSIFTSIASRHPGLIQYIFEYMVIVIPLVAAHTVLAQYINVLNFIAFICIMFKFMLSYPKLEVINKFKQPNYFKTKNIQSISILRGLTYLITVCCILAVDFQAFPRNLAKTERYGFSLMDTGVGLFVIMSGLVHKDLRKDNCTLIIKSNTKFITILIFLGIGRFLSVKQLDYQEHISEYGVHWNFFFTLAVCKLLSTLLLCISNRPLLCSIVTILAHEFLLYTGLQSWVFSNVPRTDFVTANREGISSCLGYTSLYLFAAHTKSQLKNKSVLRYKMLLKLVLGCVFLWILMLLFNIYRPVSRTLTNAAYCTYLSAILLTILSVMYFFEVLFQDGQNKIYFDVPLILSAVNINGLIYFLAANLMTGFINLSVRTLFVSTSTTFIILNCYMIISIALAVYLMKKGVKV